MTSTSTSTDGPLYKINPSHHFYSLVSCLSHLEKTTHNIKAKLKPDQLALFRKIKFGHFLDLNIVFNGPLIHYLLLREDYIQLVGNSRLLEKFFKDKECVYVSDLEDIFLEYEGDDDDIVKLALVYFIEISLLGKDSRTKVDIGFFKIADDWNTFNNYDWGRIVFVRTLSALKRALDKQYAKGNKKSTQIKKYTINGFPHALQVWAYESIPTIIGCGVDKVNDHAIPRMLRWVCQQSPKSQTISQVFDSPMFIIKVVIEMTPEEEQLKIASGELFENFRSSTIIQSKNGGSKRVREVVNDEDDFKKSKKQKSKIKMKKAIRNLQDRVAVGDEDVLEKKVDIGLEEPIDVVDDEDVTEIEPFLTQRPHVRPARRKRASVYLSTPFTTLPKRSLTSTTSTSEYEAIVYDPMHKILDVHLDRLRAWITDKRTDDELRETFHGKKSKAFVRDLFMCRRWLLDERILVSKWPLYKECIKENRPFDWDEEYRLVDYVVGSKEDFQDPWASVDYVYSPFNVHGNHWVLLCLDLVSCQVKVWDSLPSLTTAEEMTNILLPIRQLVSKLLDSTGFFDRRGRSSTYKEPCPVVIVDSIPLQRNNSDCGVFTIKYFEYIAAGVGLDTLCQENMSYFRKQLAFQLWTNTPMY
ncbi:hypothetical protein IC575_006354 [Cucumis melo]